jgi:hypothetical protein
VSLVAGVVVTPEARGPGQTRKKPKDLSAREREERRCGEGGGLYAVYMRERGEGGRKECGLRIFISAAIHT